MNIDHPALTWKKIKKVENTGGGIVAQLIGFVLLFLFPFGTIVGIILLIAGRKMSTKFICEKCHNPVDKNSKMCPACKANLKK